MFKLRLTRDASEGQDAQWLVMQRFVGLELRLSSQQRTMVTPYEAVWRRHVADSALVLPTNPPSRLPFPFDVGLYARAAHYERWFGERDGWTMESARLALLLDPIHSPSGRFHFGFGPALAHQMRFLDGQLRHELVPFSQLQVVANAESHDGLWAFWAVGKVGVSLDPVSRGTAFRARADASVERVLIAVNNQPVSLQLNAGAAFADAGPRAVHEWRAGAAVKVQFFAAR